MYDFFVTKMQNYIPDHIQNIITKMKDTLLYFYQMLEENAFKKMKLNVSTPKEDIIRCYLTSILYGIGLYVISSVVVVKYDQSQSRYLRSKFEVFDTTNGKGFYDLTGKSKKK